ncbi:MAG: hypothetical protein ACYC9V_09100 [Desulfobacteria bacterium]
MARVLTNKILCGLANGVLQHKDPEASLLDPENNFSVYAWQGHLDRLQEPGAITDAEYLALLELFPEDSYEIPMRKMLFVH